jgi:DNA-binding NarL/FixJ family response regulator
VRVLVVDDQPLFRHAIAKLIDAQPDFEVVGDAGNGVQGVEQARAVRPNLVILDVEMPVMDGLAALRILREELPDTKVVMLTVSREDDLLVEAVRAGAHGYLLKDLRPEELYDLMRAVMRDESPVAPVLASRLLAEVRTRAPAADSTSPERSLSPRELNILRLVAEGLTNKEIGSRLFITEGTVKNHIHNALRKLGMENRIQAAAYIVRQGLGAP